MTLKRGAIFRNNGRHWFPNLGDVAELEVPLPPNPKLVPPREERIPFDAPQYVSRKRPVAYSPYRWAHVTQKVSSEQAAKKITPPESEAEKERIRCAFRTYWVIPPFLASFHISFFACDA